jgi:hypothetical protein
MVRLSVCATLIDELDDWLIVIASGYPSQEGNPALAAIE